MDQLNLSLSDQLSNIWRSECSHLRFPFAGGEGVCRAAAAGVHHQFPGPRRQGVQDPGKGGFVETVEISHAPETVGCGDAGRLQSLGSGWGEPPVKCQLFTKGTFGGFCCRFDRQRQARCGDAEVAGRLENCPGCFREEEGVLMGVEVIGA